MGIHQQRLPTPSRKRYCDMGKNPVCKTSSFIEKMKALWKYSTQRRHLLTRFTIDMAGSASHDA